MTIKSVVVCSVLISILPLACQAQGFHTDDQSDWWSLLNEYFSWPEIKPKNIGLDDSNFQIAGIRLSETQFDQAAAKLGKAQQVQRGDASSGRQQVCYQSETSLKKTYLIFEFGETEETFYLFTGGPRWENNYLCVKSKLVTADLGSASGLKLGIGRTELQTILGPPDAVSGDQAIYHRQFKQKTTAQEFERMRKEYPSEMNDAEAHKHFDFFSVSEDIVARFTNGRLSYLAVSKAN